MRTPPKTPAELVDKHRTSREFAHSAEGDRVLFLERADYVSPDYQRRLLVEFDWHRAAQDEKPWRWRLYVRKDHATSPHGAAWRLARRESWASSLRSAVLLARDWLMTGQDDRGRRPHRRTRPR